VTTKRRQIAYAWGPLGGGELLRARAIEFAITAGSGGHGTVWLDELVIETLPVPPAMPPRPTARASSGEAPLAVDGVASTAWTPAADDRAPWLELDLGYERDFGGLILSWRGGGSPRDYDIELAGADGAWRTVRAVRGARGARDYLPLPESEARRIRIAPRGSHASLGEVAIEPVDWAADPNSLYVSMARDAPRGSFPRAFIGEQSYWTIVGAPGGRASAIGDGALEVARGDFSPFLWADGHFARGGREDRAGQQRRPPQ
jgi:hypothetical protein